MEREKSSIFGLLNDESRMNFTLKVTLTGIKGFYRIYRTGGDVSLYAVHKQIRSDLEFPQDQLIMFKALNGAGGVVARYGLFDLGSGTVDQTSLAQAVQAGTVRFVYFYDVTNRKSVDIEVTEDPSALPAGNDFPVLVDAKGPNPVEFENGYVAFEDLPDRQRRLPGEETEEEDDDEEAFDEEEDTDDDEDGQEIFDENE